ncbi:MAG: S1 RNA-binding domain-containing protein [Bacilli bacterium]
MRYKVDEIVKATVTGIETYGVFLALDDDYSGLIHISEISLGFVKDINDFVKIGDNIFVEILDINESLLRLKLSIKYIDYKKNEQLRKAKIKETNLGFRTLALNLPLWIEKSVKKEKNVIISIDK